MNGRQACVSPNIIRLTKLRRLRCGGNVERTGLRRMYMKLWLESQKERHKQGDIRVGGRILTLER
jgi:hypothetical protein